ncbi:PREDICTED: uncharacterized protein LOC109230030 [Nicotiana attenuata]|uniref:uncharacterized protein LOC109230030 n=1 Tax=Nicotiana attenuata TaxID=49451 RepID=UPI0009053EF6|nr:PREDICTED: uncharacterized protein LOC109230030 [Nicotiana attenuata]
MPLFIFRQLGLGEPRPTTVILKLADRSLAHPEGVIEDVLVQVGSFIFPADFIILDYDRDQEVLFILGRSFLATGRATIDVCQGKMTMRVADRVEVFNVYRALKLLAHYEELSMISVVESEATLLVPYMRPEDLVERVLIGDVENSEDERVGEIEQVLDTSCSYVHGVRKFEELDRPVTLTLPRPSIEEAPKLELKPLPAHLRYAYLGNSETLPVIISSSLTSTQEEKLVRVLREHKKAIGWTIADIKGTSPSNLFRGRTPPRCRTAKEIKSHYERGGEKEVIKLPDADIIFPISDSNWVSPVQCVPKKGGLTAVENEKNKLIPLALLRDGESALIIGGTIRIQSDCHMPEDQEKTTFTCPYGTFAFKRMLFGLCNAPATFQRVSRSGIVIDKAKVEAVEKLPPPISVKGVRNFLGHAGFYRCFIKDFSKIATPLCGMLEKGLNYTTTEKELLAVVRAFEKFQTYFVGTKVIVHTDHATIRNLM